MSETPSLISHIPFLSHNTATHESHESSILPHPSNVLSPLTLLPDPSNRIPTDPSKLTNLLPEPTKLIPTDPSKLTDLLPDPTKLIPTEPSKLTDLLPDPTKLIPTEPSKLTDLLPDPTKLIPTEPSKLTDLLPDPTKLIPTGLLQNPSDILRDPSKVLSTLLSSATNNPLTSTLGQVLDPSNLLGVFPFPLSFTLRRLLIVGAVLLLLLGFVVAGTMVGLVVLSPLFVTFSPLWVPIGVALFAAAVGFLSLCGFAVVVAAAVAWVVKRFYSQHD